MTNDPFSDLEAVADEGRERITKKPPGSSGPLITELRKEYQDPNNWNFVGLRVPPGGETLFDCFVHKRDTTAIRYVRK